MEDPQMYSIIGELSQEFFDEVSDEEDDNGCGPLVALDEAHWNAIVFHDAIALMIKPKQGISKHFHASPVGFWIGRPGQALTLRSFVSEIQSKMTRNIPSKNTCILEIYKHCDKQPVVYTGMKPAPWQERAGQLEFEIARKMPDDAIILSSSDLNALQQKYGYYLDGLFNAQTLQNNV